MRHCALRVLSGGMALALVGFNQVPGTESTAYAASNGRDSVSAAQPSDACVTLTDRNGQRIRAQANGSIIGTASTRQCPNSAIAAPPERAKIPAPPLAAPSHAPTPASVAEAPDDARPVVHAPKKRKAQQRSAQPTSQISAAKPASTRLVSGRVTLDTDASHAARAAQPLVLAVSTERLTATVITGGSVMLLLHSGLWTSLLILGLPLWRHVDLLPICERGPDTPDARNAACAMARAEAAVADVFLSNKPTAIVPT